MTPPTDREVDTSRWATGAPLKQLVLTRLRVTSRTTLPGYVAANLDVQCELVREIDRMIAELRAEVLADYAGGQAVHDTVTVTFDVPATWWQHLKWQHRGSRWLGWLARYRPPRMQAYRRTAHARIDLERYRTFPEATVRFPPALGREVRVLIPQPPIVWTLDGDCP